MPTPRAPALATLLAVLSLPATSVAQDAAATLAAVDRAMGAPPRTLRITAAGSEYDAAAGNDGQFDRVRVESYTFELDLEKPAASERLVLVSQTATEIAAGESTVALAIDAASPWATQYRLWITPYGFLAGAHAAAVQANAAEIEGVPYEIVSFTPANGEEVRGYVNDENVIEKTRTEFSDPVRGDVKFEASYFDWTQFDGIRYPTTIIEKENDALHRVLIVREVERDAALDPAPAPRSAP